MRTQRASIVYRLVAVVLLIVATGGAATPLRAARLQATTITFTGTELLGRPTANSVMVTILPNSTIEYYYEYGTASGVYTGQTTVATATGGQPSKTAIGGLASNQKYYYRMKYHLPGETDWVTRAEYSFRTQRAAGSTFTFDVTSDSHVNIILGNAARWTQALTRVANDAPDFLIDLGDTFAMDTVTTVAGAESAYKYQYQFFNLASASAPIFLAPGNHEQEEGWNLDDSPSQALLSINARKKYYPNPISDAFYSANTDTLAGIDGDHLREDYYAWQWGDVLFVVIDPFQYTMQLPYSPTAGEPNDEGTPTYDRWTWTLGQTQFNWLKSTLENSSARFKFVFAHHMVGGSADYVRGGANPAHMFEWGGYNLDGTTWGWSTRRPGWGDDPIHQILVANHVSAFFHGHDHQYAYEKRDGVVYQSAPAASFTGGFGIYTTGSGYTVWADSTQGPGYLRVAVNPCQATVDYIDTNTGAVDYSYVIGSGGTRWTGATSTDWNTAGNWSCGVPANTCATDVVIPGGLANYPVLNAESWVRNLTIESGATLNGGSQTLHVCGNWANSGAFTGGTGTVSFEGTTAMSGGSANNNFNHVIIASGKSLSAGGETLNVNGNWTDNGTFTPGASHVIFGGTTQTSQGPAGGTTYYLGPESFTGTTFPPAGWDRSTGTHQWARSTGAYYTSPASASSGLGSDPVVAWLRTPLLALGAAPTLSFWERTDASGAVEADGAVSTNSAASGSSITVNHTTGSGDNRLMLVSVYYQAYNQTNPVRTITSVTFTPTGGSATNLGNPVGFVENGTARAVAIYKYVAPPQSTSGTVTVNFSASVGYGIVVGVANFKGVDQTTPLGLYASNTGTTTTNAPTVNVTAAAGDLVYDSVGLFANPPSTLTPTGRTALWNLTISRARGAASTKTAAGASVAMDWTAGATGQNWAIGAVAIKPAAAGTPGGTHALWACTSNCDTYGSGGWAEVTSFAPPTGGWQQRVVNLAAYANQSVYLAFRHTGTAQGSDGRFVDDVAVYGAAGGDQTFNNLTVASGTRTFLNNATVTGNLTINQDAILEMGTYKILSVGGSTTYLTGYLSNNETRSVGTSAVSFYDGRGSAMTNPTAQLTRDSGSGSYTVKTRAGWYFPDDDFGTTCPAATNAVWRYYNILAPDATSATVRLYYRDAELNGNTESELKIWHCSGGAWHEQAGTVTRDTGANWVQVTGVTDFSPFVLTSSQYGPTAVTLARFEAYVQDNQVVVEWETASERNSAGFFVYREGADGQRERVNRQIVPAFVGVAAGGVYRVVDAGAQPGGTYTYTLEEIEARGRSQRYGPFEVTAAQPAASLPAEDAGAGYARAVRPADLVAQPAQPASNRGLDVPALLPGAPGQPGILPAPESGTGEPAPEAAEGVEAVEPAPDAVIAAAPGAAKLSLTEAGLYYLDAGDIAPALGLSMSQVTRLIKSNGLQLTVQGQTVATLAASGNAGLYFYGQGLDSPYAADNVYWLAQAKGVLMGALKPKVPAAVGLATFGAVSHAEQDLLPAVGQFNDPAADYWLWDYVVAGDASLGRRSFAVQADGAAPAGAASLTARFLGLTDAGTGADHHAQIVLNGAVIGEAAWAGAEAHEVVLAVDPALLAGGANTVEVVGVLDAGVPYSLFYVDGFDLSYPRYYRASNDALAFTSADSKAATVYGFSSSNVLVFDLSDPLRPVRVTALRVEAAEGGYRVTFKPAAAGAPHLAVAAAAVSRITTLAADAPSALTGPNGADYVIITTAALAEPAGALAAYRQGQGLAAQVVDVQDIYDEFNAGLANPQALRAFLAYAYANWAPAPRYVLLAGAGSYDYKNHLGYGDSLAPPLLVSTFDGLTAADSRYGDVVGDDGAPELAVGRLPVLTAGEFAAVIAKLQAYEAADPTGWSNQVLLLADNVDPEAGDFPADSAGLAAGLPAGYTAQQVYVGPLSAAEARGQALAALSSGVGVFSYIGHAGVDALAAERLLTGADVAGLQNGPRLGFMSAATCLVGDYSLPGYRSLGVALALQGDGGAAAVFSPTGASYNGDGVALATALFGELFGGAGGRAGDAVRAALVQYAAGGGARYALDTYNLLGDPATVLAWR